MSEAGGRKGAGRRRKGAADNAREGRALVVAGADRDDVPVNPGQDVIVPRRHRNDGWTPIRQRAFLRGLSEMGSVKDVCARLGMSTTSAYRLRSVSVTFAEQWDKAAQIVQPILEQAAFERGVEGWDEAIYYQGKVVGYRKRYSDAALGMLLKNPARDAGPGPDASVEELELHAHKVAKRAGGTFRRDEHEVSMAEVEAEMNKRIDAIIAARGRKGAGRRRTCRIYELCLLRSCRACRSTCSARTATIVRGIRPSTSPGRTGIVTEKRGRRGIAPSNPFAEG